MTKLTIDRIEGDFAVIETPERSFFNMPLNVLPTGAHEGSVISISLDEDEENARRKRIEDKVQRLWK